MHISLCKKKRRRKKEGMSIQTDDPAKYNVYM